MEVKLLITVFSETYKMSQDLSNLGK